MTKQRDMSAPRVDSLRGVKGTVGFRGPDGALRIAIDDGAITVLSDGDADCTLISDERGLLARLVSGQQNLVTAFLQGRVRIEGDPTLAVEIAGSMPDVGRLVAGREKGEPWPANP